MDNLLIERAVDVGVEVRMETSFRAPIVQGNEFNGLELRSADGCRYSVYAPLALDATGRNRSLARSFAPSAPRKAGLVAFKTHMRNVSITKGTCEIYSYPGGYGGCSEIEAGLYNLCFISDAASVRHAGADPETAFRKLVMTNSRAKEVLKNAEFVGVWHAVPIAKFGRESQVPFQGVFAVGDAAAFIDPFTGSGIALALESSKLATMRPLTQNS